MAEDEGKETADEIVEETAVTEPEEPEEAAEADEADEEVYECPDCGAAITTNMAACPSCGVGLSFEIEENTAEEEEETE